MFYALTVSIINLMSIRNRVIRCRDRIIVGVTTTYAISAYHHWCCELESRSGRGVQHVIKFVSDLRQVVFFLRASYTNKIYRYDITEILLKVALNTIKQTNRHVHKSALTWSSTNKYCKFQHVLLIEHKLHLDIKFKSETPTNVH